jgi:hypothetical protein
MAGEPTIIGIITSRSSIGWHQAEHDLKLCQSTRAKLTLSKSGVLK